MNTEIGRWYLYEVIKTKSPDMRLKSRFFTLDRLHDNRKKDKIVELADGKCRDYTLRLIESLSHEEYQELKKKRMIKKNVCPFCNGKGEQHLQNDNQDDWEECDECNGSGIDPAEDSDCICDEVPCIDHDCPCKHCHGGK